MGNPRFMADVDAGRRARGESRDQDNRAAAEEPVAMEAKLRESPEWFFATLRSIGDAVVASDEKGRVTFLNQSAEVLTGWSQAEACGRKLQDVLRIERVESEPMLSGAGCPGLKPGPRGGPEAMEAMVIARDGGLAPVEATSALIREENGLIRGVVRILRDTTERRKAGENLRRSELRFRNLVDKSQDILFTLSSQGIITSLNPAFEKITGWAREDFLYRPFSDLVHPEDGNKAWEEFQQVLSGRNTTLLEMRVRTKSCVEIVLECGSAPTLEEGRPCGVWGIARDITQRKRLEQRVLQTQKMEAIARVAGGIAHDFNNLLTAINGYTDFLKQSLGSGSPLLANVDGILSSVSRAATLTRQLLAFSRQKQSQARRLDLNSVVVGMLPALTELLEENISLDLDLAKALGPVFADPAEMEQALMLLIANAREAMPKGGRLSIRTLESEERSAPAGSEAARQISIAVSDTGCGMTDAVKARLFEPFFTTKPIGKGMGLGLSTVYGIVKLGGGDIQFDSVPEAGTSFTLSFPRLEEKAGVEPDAQATADTQPGGETILLVEDDDEVRFLLYSILKSDGYSVLEARDGEQALDLASSHRGHIHLVLTDLHMPKMGGRRLVETLLPRHPGMKIMVMSGFSREDFPAMDGQEAPISFLQKPFMPKSLIRQIRKMLDG